MPDFQPVSNDERVRILESRYSLMRDRLFLINQNMINEYRKLNKELKISYDEIKNIKQELNEIKSLLRNVVNEMQNFAKKEDVKVIEKYMELINPLNSITEEEVRKIIRGEKHSKGITHRES